jgi:hypothetical protein
VNVAAKSTLIGSFIALFTATANAEFYTQLNGAGQTTTYAGNTGAVSHFDTGVVTAPDLPLVAVGFDNFQLVQAGIVTNIAWSGNYDLPAGPRTTAFQLALYNNNPLATPSTPNGPPSPLGAGPGPGTQIGTLMNVAAIETNLGGGHYSYTADVSGFGNSLQGGTQYWLSVAAAMPYNLATGNGFGWAFSNAPAGDDLSWQYTQNGPVNAGFYEYQRYHDSVDYSFSIVTAVPEPSSCLLVAGALGGFAFKTWRKRRQKIAA